MDERVMLLATAPPEVVPALFLNSYFCHIMGSVVRKI
jgi:hypothetical protein